jgi:hypothetical protein
MSQSSELEAALEELERKKSEVRILEEKIEIIKSCRNIPSEISQLKQCAPGGNLPRKQFGVVHRKGKQEKGGTYGAGCFEEILWDPKAVMPALGIRPVGHIRTCFPRKNGQLSRQIFSSFLAKI